MVFVMILIKINSVETSAACAAGVKCFFSIYSLSDVKVVALQTSIFRSVDQIEQVLESEKIP